ncbi:MAG: FeoA family protein [Thermoguttaceae bacterium]|jgi:Fe2+ transport system protein FeoA
MNLSKVGRGGKVTIVSLRTNRAMEERLASLGLFPGAEIEVVRNSLGGEMILACMNSRFALGRKLAHSIEVG